MAESNVIKASVRTEHGSRASRRLRDNGLVPGVIYGHKEESVMLAIPKSQIDYLLRHGTHGLLELDVDGKTESAVIKELQWNSFGRDVLHVDFTRVSKGELITVEVPLVMKGTAAGATAGGVVDVQLHSLKIECPADKLVESITINISDLQLGKAIHVKDLQLPEGVRSAVDPDLIVVHVVSKRDEAEPSDASSIGAEPEVIRREGKTEDSEGT